MARGVVGTLSDSPEQGGWPGGVDVKATPLPAAIAGSTSALPMTSHKESMSWPNAPISASVPLSLLSFRLSPASAGVPSAAAYPEFYLQVVPSIPSPTASTTTHPLPKVQAHPTAYRIEPNSALGPHCPPQHVPTTQSHARLSSRASACTASPVPSTLSSQSSLTSPLSQDPGKRQLLTTPSQIPWLPANVSLPPQTELLELQVHAVSPMATPQLHSA